MGSDYGKGPSQPDEKARNVLDAIQALEKVASFLVDALVNVRREGNPCGRKGCSFKEFDEHPFQCLMGT
jgi:hypothetical protein